jgi:hypothetical protein
LTLRGVLQLEGCVVIADARIAIATLPRRSWRISRQSGQRRFWRELDALGMEPQRPMTSPINRSGHRGHRQVRGVPISPLKKFRMSGSTSPTVNSLLFEFAKH